MPLFSEDEFNYIKDLYGKFQVKTIKACISVEVFSKSFENMSAGKVKTDVEEENFGRFVEWNCLLNESQFWIYIFTKTKKHVQRAILM